MVESLCGLGSTDNSDDGCRSDLVKTMVQVFVGLMVTMEVMIMAVLMYWW